MILGLEFARRRAAVERRIDRQAQVGARSFQIVGDGERAANYRVAVEPSRCPGKSKARLEGLAAIDALVERAAGAAYTGSFQLAGCGIEVVLLIVGLNPWRMRFIAQAESQGQAIGYAPGILRRIRRRRWKSVPSRRC